MSIYLKCLQNITKLPTENKNHIDKLSERKISWRLLLKKTQRYSKERKHSG